MDQDVVKELKDNLELVLENFRDNLKKLRTGRAHPSMVEDVMIDAYGVQSPLKQLATITTPEPQLIQISPFDPSTLTDIANSIRSNQSLGLNPVDDGKVIRIQIPPLTTERRQLIVKQLKEKQEEAHIGIRKARHDAIAVVDKAKKDKSIGEDDAKRTQKDIDDIVNSGKSDIDTEAKNKETEVLNI